MGAQEMNEFNMEDVKEILFNQTLAAYNEKKGMISYIKQLEEKIKELEENEPKLKEVD